MRGAFQVAELTFMIRATRGRSRSTNHWKGDWMVRGVPKRLDLRWFAVICMALFFELFSKAFFFRFFSMLGRFWEVLGGQSRGQNRFLGCFFSMFFSIAFWHRFWMDFLSFGT